MRKTLKALSPGYVMFRVNGVPFVTYLAPKARANMLSMFADLDHHFQELSMTDITREAVEARAAALRARRIVQVSEPYEPYEEYETLTRDCKPIVPDGDAIADMLLALLDRAEKGEEMAQFYKDAFLKMEADFEVGCVERDEARKQTKVALKMLRERPTAPHPIDQMNNLERFLREDVDAEVRELTADLAAARKEIERMNNETPEGYVTREQYVEDLAAARKTIEGLVEIGQRYADETVKIRTAKPLPVGPFTIKIPSDEWLAYSKLEQEYRVALAQANKTEGV